MAGQTAKHVGVRPAPNLHSRRQFCSRYVREVIMEATGRSVGEVETFSQLLSRHRGADLSFWKLWYFGRIPWERESVTLASVMLRPELRVVFDGGGARLVKPPEAGRGAQKRVDS